MDKCNKCEFANNPLTSCPLCQEQEEQIYQAIQNKENLFVVYTNSQGRVTFSKVNGNSSYSVLFNKRRAHHLPLQPIYTEDEMNLCLFVDGIRGLYLTMQQELESQKALIKGGEIFINP